VVQGSVNVAAPTTYNLFPKNRGYYTLEAELSNNGVTTSVIAFTATLVLNAATTFCHLSLPGWTEFGKIAGTPKIMGVSVLASCVAPALNRNGDVLVTQQSYSRPWPALMYNAATAVNYFNVVTAYTPPEMYSIQNWEKGAYAFLKPEAGLVTLQNPSFKWRAPLQGASSSTVGCVVVQSPYTENDYLAVLVQTQTSNPAGVARLTFDFWLNYESMTPWLSGSMPTINTLAMQECIDKIAVSKQFFENPLHLGALLSFAKTAAASIIPSVMPYLTQLGNAALAKLHSFSQAEARVSPPAVEKPSSIKQLVVRKPSVQKVRVRTASVKRAQKKAKRERRKLRGKNSS
jgi:hypothetical protein